MLVPRVFRVNLKHLIHIIMKFGILKVLPVQNLSKNAEVNFYSVNSIKEHSLLNLFSSSVNYSQTKLLTQNFEILASLYRAIRHDPYKLRLIIKENKFLSEKQDLME
jgi:hypothetical protein